MKSGQRRMVHFSIWSSGQVARLSKEARLLYIGLITLGDDDGRLKADPRLIRSQVFPYDEEVKISDVEKWMKECAAQNLVTEYQVDGDRYIFHPKWEDYQLLREDRRRESNIPAPLFEFSPTATIGQPSVNQVGDKRRLKVSKDKVSKDNLNTTGSDSAFVVFWEKYPYKVGKKAAWKAWQKIGYTPELGVKIMASLESWKATPQWTKDEGRYIPHPATWLNGERWEDEVSPAKKRSSKYDHVGSTTSANS